MITCPLVAHTSQKLAPESNTVLEETTGNVALTLWKLRRIQ